MNFFKDFIYNIIYVRKNVCYNIVTNFRKDIYELLEQTIKYNEPLNISTKNGNAVVLSEEDYNNLMETLYISSISGLKEDIVEGLEEDIEDCVEEEKVEW